MDISKRLLALKERAGKPKSGRTRPRLRANRTLKLESLDQRRLMAADFSCDMAPPTPEPHVLTAVPDDAILASDIHNHIHYHGDRHDHGLDHDHDCNCHLCQAVPGQAAFGGGDSNNAPNGKWSQPGGLGSPVTVTYSYAGLLDGNFATGSLTERELRASVEEAFGMWANYAPLNFVEVVDSGPEIFINGQDNTTYLSGNTPDIRIDHHTIDGLSGTLAYAYFPETNYWGTNGDIHFDTAEPWQLGNDNQGNGAWATDFLEVMTHEIGHALGLEHESAAASIMHPFNAGSYNGLGTGFLYEHDIDSIRGIYGTGVGSVAPIVTNQTPVITPIEDLTIPDSQSLITVTVPVHAADADGDALTYSANVMGVDAMQYEAYRLNQSFDLRPASSDYQNVRGYGEKYFYGEGSRWFFVLPDGGVHRWSRSIEESPEIGKLDGSYHDQLGLLTEAAEPVAQPIPANVAWSGSELNVTASTTFATTFLVSVNVADRYDSANETFYVHLVNSAPVIDAIADQTSSVLSGSITVDVSAIDPDGDTVMLDASVVQTETTETTAYQLNQAYGFQAAHTEAFNYRGHGEKYFYGNGSRWFFMLPGGEVHRWKGSISTSPEVGKLDTSYHDDLSLLYGASEPEDVPVNVAWSGTELTLNWGTGVPRDMEVSVTASDQNHESRTMFRLNFINEKPVLETIENQNVSVGSSAIAVPVVVSDGDLDQVQLSAMATGVSTDAIDAFNLKTQFGFYWAGRDGYNARGHGEKYFRGEGSRWFFMMPDGNIHRWRGSIAASPIVGNVDSSYHTTLQSFLAATQPIAEVIDIDMTWQGNDLQIQIPDQYVGSFNVTVTASDGQDQDETQFAVNVSSAPNGQSAAPTSAASTLLSMHDAIDQLMSQLG